MISGTFGIGIILGDINGDDKVDLKDAVLCLQVIAGLFPTGNLKIEADVNNDKKIGLEEAVYVLQKVAGSLQIFYF